MPGCNAERSGRVQPSGCGPLSAKACGRRKGCCMPGFFGYCGWAVAFLIPVFILATFVFFR
jgi:hypothetical protein